MSSTVVFEPEDTRSNLPIGYRVSLRERDDVEAIPLKAVKEKIFSKMISIAQEGLYRGEMAPLTIHIAPSTGNRVLIESLKWFSRDVVQMRLFTHKQYRVKGSDISALITRSNRGNNDA